MSIKQTEVGRFNFIEMSWGPEVKKTFDIEFEADYEGFYDHRIERTEALTLAAHLVQYFKISAGEIEEELSKATPTLEGIV